MQIMQIEDSYAAKNGGTPNDHIFLIQNFKDNKEGLLYFFNYLEDSIKPRLPFNKYSSYCEFYYNKNDIYFDDGTYYGTDIKNYNIVVFQEKKPHFFSGIDFYPNKPTNPQTYTIKKQGNFIDIVLDYKELQRKPLKEFLKNS